MNLDNNPSWVQWSLKGIWTWSYGCSLWWAAWVQWPLWLGQAGWGTLVRHHQMKWFSMRNPKVLHWHFQSKWMFSNDNPWNFQCYFLFINHPPINKSFMGSMIPSGIWAWAHGSSIGWGLWLPCFLWLRSAGSGSLGSIMNYANGKNFNEKPLDLAWNL